jgi:hypothetical protein
MVTVMEKEYLSIYIFIGICLILLGLSVVYKNFLLSTIVVVLIVIFRIFILPAGYESESKSDDLSEIVKDRIKNRKFITNARVEISHLPINTFIALFLTWLCIDFYIRYINSEFKTHTGMQDVFLISLTFILVYATLSLLFYTYALVLKNEEDENLIRTEIELDYRFQYKIEKKINESLQKCREKMSKDDKIKNEEISGRLEDERPKIEKFYLDGTISNMIKGRLEDQIRCKKTGQAFLRATLFSGVSFLFIVSYFVFNGLNLSQIPAYCIPIRKFILANNGIFFFQFFTLYIIIYSIIYFLKGLIEAFHVLLRES